MKDLAYFKSEKEQNSNETEIPESEFECLLRVEDFLNEQSIHTTKKRIRFTEVSENWLRGLVLSGLPQKIVE